MKKLLISATLIIGMVAGAMVLSSFTRTNGTPKMDVNSSTDDGWEDWTSVTAYCYKQNDNGEWIKTTDTRPNSKVQRRMSCGEREYRIKLYMTGDPTWSPVTKSPTDDFPYCSYKGRYAWCFRM